jgi:hypothetical protein
MVAPLGGAPSGGASGGGAAHYAAAAAFVTNPTMHQNAYHHPQNAFANSHPYGMHMHQNAYHPPQNTVANGHPVAGVSLHI